VNSPFILGACTPAGASDIAQNIRFIQVKQSELADVANILVDFIPQIQHCSLSLKLPPKQRWFDFFGNNGEVIPRYRLKADDYLVCYEMYDSNNPKQKKLCGFRTFTPERFHREFNIIHEC
jgi:hypothetical protein